MRWATIAIGLAMATADDDGPRLVALGLPLVVYAAVRTVRPLRYRLERLQSLLAVLAEVAITLAVVVATGYWRSPYVLTVTAAVLAAGLARGFAFAVRTAVAAALAVAIPYHLEVDGAEIALTLQWSAELLLIAVVAGHSRRLFGEAEGRSWVSAQANELLSQLHDLAQSLPSSLDLHETVASTVRQARSVSGASTAALLAAEEGGTWTVAASEGAALPARLPAEALPAPFQRAVRRRRPALVDLDPGAGLSPDARTALYLPLVTRDHLVGVLALEHPEAGALRARAGDAAMLARPAALAVDNARWFGRIRTVGADEERQRIARDLHDRVGQSLASLGFELDRLSRRAEATALEDDITQLREEVRRVTAEVRDTLHDLRTDVTPEQGLVATLDDYLDRVRQRTGAEVVFDADEAERLPLRQEREVWRIAQEAVANAVRHADASQILVRWTCRPDRAELEVVDDGRGLPPLDAVTTRTYGLTGMQERASAVGAVLEISGPPGAGTTVRCRWMRR